MMKSKVYSLALLLFAFVTQVAQADPAPASFRTPAKRYGSAYSVKLTLWRAGFSYVIPVWIRPDQKESSLDRGQIAFMGWNYPDLNVEEVEVSGEPLELKSFKAARSDWAVVPEYPKNCCMGVIGQDILKYYQLRFDPKSPSHIEWIPLDRVSGKGIVNKELDAKLKAIFSIKNEYAKIGKETFDLSVTPYILNLSAGSLIFEHNPSLEKKGSKTAIFNFEFLPPYRRLRVSKVNVKLTDSVKKRGFHPGVAVIDLNGESVTGLNRFEIEDLLKGKRAKNLEIGFYPNNEKEERLKVIFDFEKNEFITSGSIPSGSGRN